MFDEATLRRLWPNGDSKVKGLVAGIATAAPVVFPKYGIKSALVIRHAMAQFSHECGAGTEMVENIHYTAERAVQVWPSRFHSAADVYTKIGSFVGDPQFAIKLIDNVYGNRMGNRPGTHDGSQFIGRGLSQCTGREGYARLSKKIGVDLVANPELIMSPALALECGVADFVLCGCLPFAEADNIVGVTQHLNGGQIGIDQRRAWLAKWKAVDLTLPTVAAPAVPSNPPISDAPAASTPQPSPIVQFIVAVLSALFKRK